MAFHNDYMEDDRIGQEMDMPGLPYLPKAPSAPEIRLSIESPKLEQILPVSRTGDKKSSPGASFPGEVRSGRPSYPNLAVPLPPKYRDLEPSDEGRPGEPIHFGEGEPSDEEQEECCSWGPSCLIGAACGIMGASAAVGGILSAINASRVEEAKEEVENAFSITQKNLNEQIDHLQSQLDNTSNGNFNVIENGESSWNNYNRSDCQGLSTARKEVYCEALMALIPEFSVEENSLDRSTVRTFIDSSSWSPDHSMQRFMNNIVLPENRSDDNNIYLLTSHLMNMMWEMTSHTYGGQYNSWDVLPIIDELGALHTNRESWDGDLQFLFSNEYKLQRANHTDDNSNIDEANRWFEREVFTNFADEYNMRRGQFLHDDGRVPTREEDLLEILQDTSLIEFACNSNHSYGIYGSANPRGYGLRDVCRFMLEEQSMIKYAYTINPQGTGEQHLNRFDSDELMHWYASNNATWTEPIEVDDRIYLGDRMYVTVVDYSDEHDYAYFRYTRSRTDSDVREFIDYHQHGTGINLIGTGTSNAYYDGQMVSLVNDSDTLHIDILNLNDFEKWLLNRHRDAICEEGLNDIHDALIANDGDVCEVSPETE